MSLASFPGDTTKAVRILDVACGTGSALGFEHPFIVARREGEQAGVYSFWEAT